MASNVKCICLLYVKPVLQITICDVIKFKIKKMIINDVIKLVVNMPIYLSCINVTVFFFYKTKIRFLLSWFHSYRKFMHFQDLFYSGKRV